MIWSFHGHSRPGGIAKRTSCRDLIALAWPLSAPATSSGQSAQIALCLFIPVEVRAEMRPAMRFRKSPAGFSHMPNLDPA